MHRLPFSGVRVILWATPEGMVRSHAGRPGGRLGIVASRTAKTSCHRFAESQRYAFDLKRRCRDGGKGRRNYQAHETRDSRAARGLRSPEQSGHKSDRNLTRS